MYILETLIGSLKRRLEGEKAETRFLRYPVLVGSSSTMCLQKLHNKFKLLLKSKGNGCYLFQSKIQFLPKRNTKHPTVYIETSKQR